MNSLRFLKDRRVLVIGAIALVLLALQFSGLGKALTMEMLRTHRADLGAWVEAHRVLAAVCYLGIYIAVAALSLPGGAGLTLIGGFLFGPVLGGCLAVLAASTGAVLVFLFARRLFGDDAVGRLGPKAASLAANIRANAWSYLLVLRLVPLFPFFLVNLVPAFVGVRLKVFALTTVFGIIPATFVFALAGSGLGRVFDSGEAFSVKSVLTPEIWGGLLGLALLSLAGIPLRRHFEARRNCSQPRP
ncbi:TVP38/TMEM64 family protein [Phreatobacter aquaticus]|uniref:TVP38/TMEM64 family protein n=1 Tax=Phreatobacter aquaticus TaxID=2570229 RepID=A0A4D7QCK9_9HYPH|nr:TVP38/TMEM64 family protein [Phreatobacter aquaticus]QCK85740.1 TVP38/TMEM64 family protein [Phreatobacter aquaticus]